MSNDLYRVLSGEDGRETAVVVPLDEWLDDLMSERDAVIMRLRALERPLVKYGRIKVESLPRRAR